MKRYDNLLKDGTFTERELLKAAEIECTGILVKKNEEVDKILEEQARKEMAVSAKEKVREQKRRKALMFKRVCVKYSVSVVMNIGRRENADIDELQDQKKCKKYKIVPIGEISNSDEGHSFEKKESALSKKIKSIKHRFEKDCFQKLSIVVNSYGRSSESGTVEKKCKKFLEDAKHSSEMNDSVVDDMVGELGNIDDSVMNDKVMGEEDDDVGIDQLEDELRRLEGESGIPNGNAQPLQQMPMYGPQQQFMPQGQYSQPMPQGQYG